MLLADFLDILNELDFNKFVNLIENGIDFAGLNIFADIEEARAIAKRKLSKKKSRKLISKFIAKVLSFL